MKALCEKTLDDGKAFDIVTIDLKDQSTIADYIVIASGTSSRQVSALSDHVAKSLKEAGVKSIRTEGLPKADWVLVDGGDIVIHIFRPEVRNFYNIEKIWGQDAPTPSTAHMMA